MAKVEGVRRVIAALKKVEQRITGSKARAGAGSSVVVGFGANYALYVHENLESYHKVGQAKFLEQPARELANNGTFAGIIVKAVKAGKTLLQALLLCGLRLQRESQLLVPVDTGNLKASAFTRIED